LRPRQFESFNWLGALEFLVATVLTHAGFRLLQSRLEGMETDEWPRGRMLWMGISLLSLACALGLHLSLQTNTVLFLAFGAAVILAGLLYTTPPAMLSQRVGGEITLSMSMGMLPLLGAYAVQVGDLTRTVYAAALPMVVATGLWVWTGLMARREQDARVGKESALLLFEDRFAGRVVVPLLAVGIYAFLIAAMAYGSLSLWVLIALVGVLPAWRVMRTAWTHYGDAVGMAEAERSAFAVHLIVGVCTVLSSLIGLWR
jgi:1,4-dihydroxy-2-naphthoate octaprenyltransferase